MIYPVLPIVRAYIVGANSPKGGRCDNVIHYSHRVIILIMLNRIYNLSQHSAMAHLQNNRCNTMLPCFR